MTEYFQNKYALSHEGAKDLIEAIFWTVLLNLSFMAPIVLGFKFLESCMPLLKGDPVDFSGQVVSYGISFVVAFVVMILVAHRQYTAAFTKIYEESAKRRIGLAETLRKLPLAFFNRKDVADLSSTIMGDATQIEQMFSHSVPQIYGAVISVFLMGLGMFFYNWQMSLAVFWVMPVSALVFVLSKKYQSRVHGDLYGLKREISDQIQESLELAQEIKSYNREGFYKDRIDAMLNKEEDAMINGELMIGETTLPAISGNWWAKKPWVVAAPSFTTFLILPLGYFSKNPMGISSIRLTPTFCIPISTLKAAKWELINDKK
jgi:ATP-binding cassette subfamily B protein